MKELELETGDLIRYKDAVDEETSSFCDSFLRTEEVVHLLVVGLDFWVPIFEDDKVRLERPFDELKRAVFSMKVKNLVVLMVSPRFFSAS